MANERSDRGIGGRIAAARTRVDRFQRRHPVVGFPVAVVKKSSDDRAGDLSAVIALYGFFSLFPILVLLTSVLGFVLEDDPELQERVLDTVIDQFPDQSGAIKDAVGGLRGSGVWLVVGAIGALWAALAVLRACQSAMDAVWGVPRASRPNAAAVTLRSLAVMVIAAVVVVTSVLISGSVALDDDLPLLAQLTSLAVSFVALSFVFLVVYRVLPDRELGLVELLPGATVAAASWLVLERLGTLLLERSFRTVSPTSVFIVALGLLVWMTLQARILVTCSEINVVRSLELWPRGLDPGDLTDADRRALARYAATETRVKGQQVSVDFDAPPRHEASWMRRRRLRRRARRGQVPDHRTDAGADQR